MTHPLESALVVERPAELYAERDHRKGEPTGEADPVSVLLPPPPDTYGLATFFRHDPKVIGRSRKALDAYRYREPKADDYPLRVRLARHTGLPDFLNGFLDSRDSLDTPERAAGIASGWLFQSLRAEVLFGVDSSTAQKQFRYAGEARTRRGKYARVADELLAGAEPEATVHARYQQFYQDRPVLGGSVVVHLAAGDQRASVTASYFPVPAGIPFAQRIDEARAITIARQALAEYVKGPGSIGLYWSLLRPWLEEGTPPKWQPWHTLVAAKLAGALVLFGKTRGHDFPDLRGLAAELPVARDEFVARLREIWQARNDLGMPEWQAGLAPHAGSRLFVFPFAGNYRLACQVELFPDSGDDGWRAFVDMESGDVLGQPERLLAQLLTIFPSSSDAIDKNTATVATADLSVVGTFMDLRFHEDQGGAPVSLAAIAAKPLDQTTTVEQEAANVAAHATRIFEHFTTVCGADAATLRSYPRPDGALQAPGLKVAVGRGGQSLEMGFNSAALLHPKVITFQTDGGAGLTSGGRLVHHPSRDPEVIVHELVHGLMWLLNHRPFDQQNASVPFGAALLEGYANYFARSLAARQDSASDLWGRAAYLEANWQDEWSLDRNKSEPGADLLPAPNLYPSDEITGLPVYDVGMVWARALWEVRELLGADRADRLALDAFHYVHGWVANFEIAAEGLIDAARKSGVAGAQVSAIIDIFARRGILAERGVQALAAADDGQGGTMLLVGTDAGLKRSTDRGDTWQDWGQTDTGGALSGVVGLAADGPIVYAATEERVYTRDSRQANGAWSPLGAWPDEQAPMCTLVAMNVPLVGTGNGIWAFIGGNWQAWQLANSPMTELVLDIGTGARAISTYVYVATMGLPQRRLAMLPQDMNWNTDWESGVPAGQPGSTGRCTTLAVTGESACIGTLADGIWQQALTENLGNWTQIATKAQLGEGAVLALRAEGQGLLAATTAGLFAGTPGAQGWAWGLVPGAPAGIIADVLPLPQQNLLLVGTAAQDLWIRDNNAWKQRDVGA